MREGELSAEHIWLRQSVTFTHEGQTRTLEIALPIRRDMAPEEIAQLLAQAEAGMAQLTSSLDRRIAGEQVAPPRPIAADPPRRPEPPRQVDTAPASHTEQPPTPPARQAQPAAQSGSRQPTPAPRPAAPTPEPVAAGPDLTRPEFIAAIGELGLNPKEAMDRLEVRSLAGLNLREALETLRRQALQDDTPPIAPAAAPTAAPTGAVAPAAEGDARSMRPPRFDEEDDEVITFREDGDDFDDDDLLAPPPAPGAAASATATLDDDPYGELGDVPDFGPAPGARSRAAQPASAEPPEPRAAKIIARLRAAHPGGVATAERQNAFANIIVAELGEPKATALVRGLWKLSPEKLGPEQLDALIRWGKGDTFSEEAEEVLAALRAEQRARASGAQSTSARGPAPGGASRRRGES